RQIIQCIIRMEKYKIITNLLPHSFEPIRPTILNHLFRRYNCILELLSPLFQNPRLDIFVLPF
ncbi:MAG: hypothetical protein ACJ73C_11010, partial [Nitrososphaeraceae archaeon]